MAAYKDQRVFIVHTQCRTHHPLWKRCTEVDTSDVELLRLFFPQQEALCHVSGTQKEEGRVPYYRCPLCRVENDSARTEPDFPNELHEDINNIDSSDITNNSSSDEEVDIEENK